MRVRNKSGEDSVVNVIMPAQGGRKPAAQLYLKARRVTFLIVMECWSIWTTLRDRRLRFFRLSSLSSLFSLPGTHCWKVHDFITTYQAVKFVRQVSFASGALASSEVKRQGHEEQSEMHAAGHEGERRNERSQRAADLC